MREVEKAIAKADAGRAAGPDLLLDLELAVAVGVAQCDDATARLRVTPHAVMVATLAAAAHFL